MAGNVALDGAYNVNQASLDANGNPGDTHLLNAFLKGSDTGIREQYASIYNAQRQDAASYKSQTDYLSANEKSALAGSFRSMLASLTPQDLEVSAAYRSFKSRMDGSAAEAPIYRAAGTREVGRPVIRTNEAAPVEHQTNTAPAGDVLQTIQQQLQKAGQIMATGDTEAGKAAFRQAIDLADQNYNREKNLAEIRQLQAMLQTNTFEGRQMTKDERLAVHGEIMSRFGASMLPFQLRSGSIKKDQAGYATVLRQYDQHETAETAYKDAVKAADAIPVAEMKKQIQLIADEMGNTTDQKSIEILSAFSATILGGEDAQGNEIPGALKAPITARKDLMEFYIRPTMKADGTAEMASAPAKDGTPKFVPDSSKVFKPEEANKVITDIDSKYKEILGIDLTKDPSKDAELAVFRATVDAHSPQAIEERKKESSYSWESGISNVTAGGASLIATLALSRFGVGKLIAKAAPSLYKAEGVTAGLSTLGKVTEFAAAGTIGTITRNQMMTNYYGRDDETLAMSITNGLASSIGFKAFYTLPKALGDKVFLRGFTAEASVARATTTTGTADGAVQLAKLKEATGVIVPKGVTTFEQWAAGASASERAAGLASMSRAAEGGSWLAKMNPLRGNNLTGQPLTAAENLSAGAITTRRVMAGSLGMGAVTTFTDAADAYSRLWPKMLNGEIKDAQGKTIEPTFQNMVVRPIYKDAWDNSFVGGALVGGLFGKPGSMFVKPWGEAFFYKGHQTKLGWKIVDAATTPFRSIANVGGGLISGTTPEFILRGITPRSSEIGALLSQNLQVQTAQIYKNYPDAQTVDIYNEQLRRHREKLIDRKFEIRK